MLHDAWLRWCIANAEQELCELQRSDAVSSALLVHRLHHIHAMRRRIATHRASARHARRCWRSTLRRLALGRSTALTTKEKHL